MVVRELFGGRTTVRRTPDGRQTAGGPQPADHRRGRLIKYRAVAVAVAVSGGVAVPVAVPMATTKNPKRTLF